MEVQSPTVGPIQSVARALRLLDWLADAQVVGEACGLQDAAEVLGVPASTAHNLLKTMVVAGYVARAERGYGLGAKCAGLSRAARLTAASAEEPLARLAAETGESCVLATLLGCRRRVVCRAEGHSLVRVGSQVEDGDRARFFEYVTGRALAAYVTADELNAIVALHGLPGAAWDGLDEPSVLETALAAIRRAGMAEGVAGNGEIVALAAPVIDPHGQLLAALGLYLPAYRADDEYLARLRSALRAAANDLGGKL